jgi:hypothetical protein
MTNPIEVRISSDFEVQMTENTSVSVTPSLLGVRGDFFSMIHIPEGSFDDVSLLYVFVTSGRYSHIGLGVGRVGIFVGAHIAFLFCEKPFYIELGLGTVIVGAWQLAPTWRNKQF